MARFINMSDGFRRKKREMYTYTQTEVKALCWKLINSYTNPEDLKNGIGGTYEEDFNIWFKENKK